VFAGIFAAARHQARSGRFTPGFEDAEEHLARHGVESGDDLA
jgi:hypothetical protein